MKKTGLQFPSSIDLINYTELFKILNKKKWLIIVATLVVTFFASYAAKKVEPEYRAMATLLIENQNTQRTSLQDIFETNIAERGYIATQLEVMKGRRLAKQVIHELSLTENPQFYPASLNGAESSNFFGKFFQSNSKTTELTEAEKDLFIEDYAISVFNKKMTIESVANTNVVKVAFVMNDPQLAADIVNKFGQIYINSHLEDMLSITEQTSSWLSVRMEDLKLKLKDSEFLLQEFIEKQNLVDADGVFALSRRELNELQTQLNRAVQARNEAYGIIRAINEFDGETLDLLSLPQISGHPLIQSIKRDQLTAESEVAELANVYGPKHPRMIVAVSALEEYKKIATDAVNNLIEGFQKTYDETETNLELVNNELQMSKEKFRDLSRTEAEYRVLSREVETNRNIYDTFLKTMREASVIGDFQTANARLLESAQVPTTSINMKLLHIVIGVFAVSLLFFSGLAILVFILTDTISNIDEVETKLGYAALGSIPFIKKFRGSKLHIQSTTKLSDKLNKLYESWGSLRTSLLLSALEQDSRIVCVTSSLPGEGKSTVATNLSVSFAKVEKVLLIEADLRKPSLFSEFTLPKHHPGLSNVLTATHELEQCIHYDDNLKLDVLVAGSFIDNPLELLTSQTFKAMIKELSSHYDRIIIDAPPAYLFPDSLVIGSVCDLTLFVVKSEKTKRNIITNVLTKIQQHNIKVAGIVLNSVAQRKNTKHKEYEKYYIENVDKGSQK